LSIFYKLNRTKRSDLYFDDDEISIQIVYYFKGKRVPFSTSVKVKTKDWDKNWRKTRTNHPILKTDKDYKHKNLLLEQEWRNLKDVIFKIQKDDKEPIVDLVKSNLRLKSVERVQKTTSDIYFEILFNQYYSWIDSDEYLIETRNSKSYVRSLIGSIKDIISYTKKHQFKNNIKLLTTDIDKEYVVGLLKYCESKGLQPSTIKKRIKILVSFSKWLEEEHKIRFIVPKPKNENKGVQKSIIWLNNNELTKIFEFKEFEIENPNHEKHLTYNKKEVEFIYDKMRDERGGDTIKYTSYEVYKDMLLFLCGTGMRFGDMSNIKVEDFKTIGENNYKREGFQKGEFVFTPQKTRREVRIPTTHMVFEIYKKYVKNRGIGMYLFPRTNYGNPISNQKFNKHIKQICKIIGLNRPIKKPIYDWSNNIVDGSDKIYKLWEVITSHIGRRTMIRTYVDIGYDRKTIMSITGHRDYKTLDVYYETTERDRFKFNHLLHSFVLENDKEQKKDEKQIKTDNKDQLFELYKQGKLTWEQLGSLLNN